MQQQTRFVFSKETQRETPDCETSPKTVSAGGQVAWLPIQKQLIRTDTVYFSLHYIRKNVQDNIR